MAEYVVVVGIIVEADDESEAENIAAEGLKKVSVLNDFHIDYVDEA